MYETYKKWAYLHLYGVSQFCALLSMKRNNNVELAMIAGMLHDMASYQNPGIDNHAEHGAIIAADLLRDLDVFEANEIDEICEAIRFHSMKESVQTPLPEILKDADVLNHALFNPLEPLPDHEKIRLHKIFSELGIQATKELNSSLSIL